jgi:hypothetical protein
MSVFFEKKEPLHVTARKHLEAAYKADPSTVPDVSQVATEKAEEIRRQSAGTFSWGRLAFASAFLLIIFFAAIYTAGKDNLQDLYKLLLHSFELMLGAVVGLITGEAISR